MLKLPRVSEVKESQEYNVVIVTKMLLTTFPRSCFFTFDIARNFKFVLKYSPFLTFQCSYLISLSFTPLSIKGMDIRFDDVPKTTAIIALSPLAYLTFCCYRFSTKICVGNLTLLTLKRRCCQSYICEILYANSRSISKNQKTNIVWYGVV